MSVSKEFEVNYINSSLYRISSYTSNKREIECLNNILEVERRNNKELKEKLLNVVKTKWNRIEELKKKEKDLLNKITTLESDKRISRIYFLISLLLCLASVLTNKLN